ncbi:hypothetical protein [Flavobacterium sp.]|uniref:hypothetical protein n=1 Tax=Flavobacterium sp. TaxID=239 RepID=UPI003D1435BA
MQTEYSNVYEVGRLRTALGDNREVTSFQNIAIKQILKLMNKYILLLLLSILINSCKSESILTGRKYQTDSINENIYTFDMKSHNYSKKMVSGTIGKGKFKTFVLSSEKILIVCNDIIWKKTDTDIKEMDKTGDSVVVGVFDGYKNLGSTIFEITSKEKKLLFRKTYVNQLQQTESEGALIKK